MHMRQVVLQECADATATPKDLRDEPGNHAAEAGVGWKWNGNHLVLLRHTFMLLT
jgi:hypothetical protein